MYRGHGRTPHFLWLLCEPAKHSRANLDLVAAWTATLGPPLESQVASVIVY